MDRCSAENMKSARLIKRLCIKALVMVRPATPAAGGTL